MDELYKMSYEELFDYLLELAKMENEEMFDVAWRLMTEEQRYQMLRDVAYRELRRI